MTRTQHPWELRFDWTLSVLHWGALVLAVFLSTLDMGNDPRVVVAGVATGAYVVSMQLMPRSIRQGPWLGEAMAVVGVMVSLVAIALTGGGDSPYLVFLAAPTFFAAAFLGLRVGLETALLSGAGLIAVSALLGQEVTQSQIFQALALYVLIAVTFAQARRVLVEERERTDALHAASLRNADRLERLAAAHGLLTSLSELATTTELNPVSVGQAALRDLALIVPFRGGQVSFTDNGASVVVARRGDTGDDPTDTYPIAVGPRRLGSLTLWANEGTDLAEARDVVLEALRPVAMAFDNIRLLRDIAARAVREERTRLARELHDEIGPSVASIGLGIDMAIHQYDPDPELARHLETLRRSASSLVEEVRRTVADLREESGGSVVELAHRLASEVGAEGPAIFIDVEERRPPRPVIAGELAAMVTEAVRNAVEHAGAQTIRIEGYVNRDQGTLVVADDGAGFDAASSPKGHFGLIGMKERAAEIDASVDVESASGRGTKITIQWGR